MNFVSWAFVALFVVVFAARLTLGRRKVESPYLGVLLLSSLVFYAWHTPVYLAVLLGSATVDYVAALAIGRLEARQTRRRHAYLVASLGVNLGLLGFFKYGAFATRSIADLAALGGAEVALPQFSLILPMGISFYTFQSLSYTIDVYRGELAPVRSFPRFLLFISFFPQLVAGPIVRASEFLPQIPRPRRLHARAFYQGAWLILLGFFLKMVCADNLAAYVDEYWDNGYRDSMDPAFALWLSVMFSGQIFADFAGYSSIAQGLGYLLGFRFPPNFNAPYIATSFKNFWERWHITLSRWLRDYLYVPLGGNRGSRARTLTNLLLVMLLGGLWHGAAYTFLAWGAIHGLCLVGERLLGLQRDAPRPLAVRLAWFAVVQSAVLVAWIFFRSATVTDAMTFLGNLVSGPWHLPALWMLQALVFLLPLVLLHLHTWLAERGRAPAVGPAGRAAVAAAMAYGILTLHGGSSDFIYFQF